MIATLLAIIGTFVLFGAIYVYGRYMDGRLGVKNDQDYYDHIDRGVIAEPKLRKRGLGLDFSAIFRPRFWRVSGASESLPRVTSPPTESDQLAVKVAHLGLLDDASELPADVLPSFEQPGDLIRWLATHTMISQSQVQKWFKGNTANLARFVSEERKKYAAKHAGLNPWSIESRKVLANEAVEVEQ